ncbi:NUDIX domain-containing protein [Candidatus Shapirobacteria bacterium]|nr:NUDIX domain-containing protein [Candidatus Shapirobacteria bacterium]
MEDLSNLGVKAIISNGKGQILVLKVSQKAIENVKGYTGGVKYDIPGGRVERGDTIGSTLAKEVMEETGYTVVNSSYFATVFSQIRLKNEIAGDVGLILAIYKTEVADGEIKLNYEHDSFEWMSPLDASKAFGDKYSVEFCEKISQLTF